tara:strand:+ start:869 stop:1174 length:306 start_codon:yes stop_codon:yes gene_type:complete
MYDYHIFCCVNERPASAVRECCKKKNSLILRNHMKKRISELGLKRVRVNQSGCLDRCELGPIMVVYPEGVWYSFKNIKDIDEIISEHLLKGKIVKRLILKS